MGETIEEKIEKVKDLRPIDDIFFEVLANDKGVCEEILRVILDDDALVVCDVIVQDSERNIYGRSVRLDALCILGTGERTNIEVQRSDNDNHLKRARFNAASITVKDSNPGDRFENVVDVCIVYISQFDLFKRNKTLYHVDKILRETGEMVDDGLSEVFVNTKVNDGSTVAELMECFLQKEVNNSKFPKLSNRMKTLKSTESGVSAVCEVMQKYQKITAIQTTVENSFEFGASKEKTIESLMRKYGLSEQEALESYEKYSPAPVASV
jgi:predicted transposase/invertase (TIGR01784 family)